MLATLYRRQAQNPQSMQMCTIVYKTLTDAMKTMCEIRTADPEGGAARVPFPLFKELYTYLAQIDGDISQDQINEVINHLQYDV